MAHDMNKRRAFSVVYERDDNNRWFVRCPDVQGAHSHGRTLASSRRNIREAIAIVLDLDKEEGFDLSEEIRLGDESLQDAIEQATERRELALASERVAAVATRSAILRALESADTLSNRDLAELLNLSHQRVQQLASEIGR